MEERFDLWLPVCIPLYCHRRGTRFTEPKEFGWAPCWAGFDLPSQSRDARFDKEQPASSKISEGISAGWIRTFGNHCFSGTGNRFNTADTSWASLRSLPTGEIAGGSRFVIAEGLWGSGSGSGCHRHNLYQPSTDEARTKIRPHCLVEREERTLVSTKIHRG